VTDNVAFPSATGRAFAERKPTSTSGHPAESEDLEMKTMHQTSTRWLIFLGLLSWAATAAGAEPESGSRETQNGPPTPEFRITDSPDRASDRASIWAPAARCDSDRRSALARWWQDRAKPRLQYSYWGYPEEFEETAFGASVTAHQNAQICSAWSARLFLYQYDFCDGGTALNLHGQQRLNEMMAAFPIWAHHTLCVESTPEQPQLALARREHVLAVLKNAGIPAQVALGTPTGLPRFGEETREINRLLMGQIRSGGGAGGGGASGGGGTSGGATAGQ
jgi:hypothetical protein